MNLSLSDHLVVFIILFGFLACQSKSEENLKLSNSIDADAHIDSTLLYEYMNSHNIKFRHLKLLKSYSSRGEFAYMEEEITLYRTFVCENENRNFDIECYALTADYKAVEHSTYGYQIDSLKIDSVNLKVAIDTILDSAIQEINDGVKKHLKTTLIPNSKNTTVNFSNNDLKKLELQTVFIDHDWESFNELRKIIMKTDSLNKIETSKM